MRSPAVLSWLRSEPSLKVASLVLAVFLWALVRSEEKPVQAFTVPLEIDGVARDLALAGDVPDNVSVRVRAPDTTLKNLSPGRFHARLRLDTERAGEVTLLLGPDNIRAPLGVEVLHVEPAQVSLRLDRRVTREIPIVPRIKGRPAQGYESDGYTLTPDKVQVEGPEGAVGKVREAVTQEVDISGRRESFETMVGVAPDRGGARLAGASNALLRVNIREQRVTRRFDGIALTPNLSPGVDYRVRFAPTTISVVLEGTRGSLDALRPGNLKALLDLEGMGPREAAYDVKPRVTIVPGDAGAGVAVHSLSEPTISVKISR